MGRARARHTTAFEVLVAWPVVRMNKSAVKELLRGCWETVGAIVDRVVARDRARLDPFDGLVGKKMSWKWMITRNCSNASSCGWDPGPGDEELPEDVEPIGVVPPAVWR